MFSVAKWAVGGIAFVLFVTPVGIQAEDKPAQGKEAQERAQRYWDCAAVCDDCARVCNACATHCSQMVAEGNKHHLASLQSCLDCANICSAAGSITARSGPYSRLICEACAKACKECGDECSKHKDTPMMARCAEVCMKCEKACQEMLKHIGAEK